MNNKINETYTEEQCDFLAVNYVKYGPNWSKISNLFNKEFDRSITYEAAKAKTYRVIKKLNLDKDSYDVDALKSKRSYQVKSRKINKFNNTLLDNAILFDDMIEATKEIMSELSKPIKIKKTKKSKSTKKTKMCKEILLSDLHIGRVSDSFGLEVAEKRLKTVCSEFIKSIEEDSEKYNVSKIIVALLGDIIESYTMHGIESAKNCGMQNSEQVVHATQLIYSNIIRPIAMLGIDVEVPCVAGNHDRLTKDKTYSMVGKTYVTHIIYHMLKNLCDVEGFKNVNFHISDKIHVVINVFGDNILYHHGDMIKGSNRALGLMQFRRDVEDQLNIKIAGARSGHTHEYCTYNTGRDIVNSCLCGQDDYSACLGYKTTSGQVMVDYLDVSGRPALEKSKLIYLEDVL